MGKNKITVLDVWPDGEDGAALPPSQWYVVNCLGQFCFIHKRSRKDAQQVANEEWGHYTVKPVTKAVVR